MLLEVMVPIIHSKITLQNMLEQLLLGLMQQESPLTHITSIITMQVTVVEQFMLEKAVKTVKY